MIPRESKSNFIALIASLTLEIACGNPKFTGTEGADSMEDSVTFCESDSAEETDENMSMFSNESQHKGGVAACMTLELEDEE